MAETRMLHSAALPLAGQLVHVEVTDAMLRSIVPIVDRVGRRLQMRGKTGLIVADLERILLLVCGDQLPDLQATSVTAAELHGVLDAVRSAALASGNRQHALVAQALCLRPVDALVHQEH